MALSRTLTSALLFFVFNLAFIFTPYWNTLTTPSQIHAALILSVPLGILWALSARGAPAVGWSRREVMAFGLLLAVCTAVNLPALSADIPWHGDEDFHVMASTPLADHLRPYLLPVVGVTAAYVMFNVFVSGRWGWLSVVSMAILSLTALIPNPLFEYAQYDPLRYPYVSRYAAALPISMTTLFVRPSPEIVYRILPFVSTVLVAYLAGRHAAKGHPMLRFAIGLFVFTTPLLLYYSSILYLELPAVFLMTIVAFHAEELLIADLDQALDTPAWLALVLIGFVKETALPFLAAFIVCRLGIQAVRALIGSRTWPSLARELRTVFAIVVPLAVFLYYRAQKPNQRAPYLQRHNLIDPEIYLVFGRAYLEQFGPLLLLGMAGVLTLAGELRLATLLFFATAFAFDTALHVLDYKDYAGYSRFNLFVVPLLVVPAAAAFDRLNQRRPRAAYAVAGVGIIVNLMLSPINLDGTKKPLWGNYLVDTSEHYYPYKRAVRWIREHDLAEKRIRFTGMPNPYYMVGFLKPFSRQDEKLVPESPDEWRSIESSLREAAHDGIDVVVYHVVGPTVPTVTETSAFEPGVVIDSQAHSLIIFRRAA